MCFNATISWGTAAVGLSASIFLWMKHRPRTAWLPLAYFACMEILQGLMYTQLGHPMSLFGGCLITVAYVHVCFQPLVFNYWLGTFILPHNRQAYQFTLRLCFIGGLFLLSRMWTTELSPLCDSWEALCAKKAIIFYGQHNIAWALPLKAGGFDYVTPSLFLHMFLFFIPGLLLGVPRLVILMFLGGPWLASFISSIPSEQSSIWCIIGLWMLVVTMLRAPAEPKHEKNRRRFGG